MTTPAPSPAPFVTGLVLAAGGSRRLGAPKQLLPYRGRTLLDASLARARAAGFDELLVTVGGAADEVRDRVDLSGLRVVDNPSYGAGCSSSIAAALVVVDPRSAGIVLLLGDQPGVDVGVLRAFVRAVSTGATLAVTRYDDGRGHPFWFSRNVFPDLAELHGDKGVWRLVESRPADVTEVDAPGPAPTDVDTWADYRALLAWDEREVRA